MKRTFIFAMMTAVAALVSCTKTELAPLKGTFPAATEPVLTSLVSSSFEKTDANRLFTVSFSGDGGAAVKTTLVGARNQYYLEPGVYGPGEKNLCFLVNGATTVNGQAIVDGQISVKKDGDNYRFIFVLFDGSGNAYRTQWQGELVYEPDPEPVKLTELLVAQVNANSTVTFKLGTTGMSIDMMGTPTGDGCALTVDLYSADGYLHEGTYTAATGDTVGEGQYAPGYEYDLSAYGMGVMHWGTCWWNNGVATHITSGPIEVAKKGAKWVVTWGSEATYPDWAVFEGAIDALTPADAPAPDYTYTDTPVPGAMDSSWQTHDDVTTHYVTVFNKAGEEVAYFQLVLDNATTDLSGEYPVVEYAHEDHKAGNGYDAGEWGQGGCRYYKDGTLVLINPGEKVTVADLGAGVYEFSGEGFDFVVGEPGGQGGDVTADYVIADAATPGAMDSSWQTHDDVTTHYLTLTNGAGEEVAYFQLVLANGTTDLSGEYPVVEYAHEDHTAGNGYDAGEWGQGGCRYYKDGALVMINPGEKVTITALADGVYKIAGDGFEFVGQVASE